MNNLVRELKRGIARDVHSTDLTSSNQVHLWDVTVRFGCVPKFHPKVEHPCSPLRVSTSPWQNWQTLDCFDNTNIVFFFVYKHKNEPDDIKSTNLGQREGKWFPFESPRKSLFFLTCGHIGPRENETTKTRSLWSRIRLHQLQMFEFRQKQLHKKDPERCLECRELFSPSPPPPGLPEVTLTPETGGLVVVRWAESLFARSLSPSRFSPHSNPPACRRDDNFRREESCDDTGQGDLEADSREARRSLWRRQRGMKSGWSDTRRDRYVRNRCCVIYQHTPAHSQKGE